VVGDAAFQNKPFSGEGITSGFAACQLAAKAAGEALRANDFSVAGLWAYNRDYYRGQGAKFAAAFAQLPAAVELSRRDVDYLFHHRVIFDKDDFRELNEKFETRMGFRKLARTAWVLVWGVLSGRFSRSSLNRLLQANSQAGKLKNHYCNYPDHPDGYPAWKKKALELWGEGGDSV
jgi:electron-transferring-flavoprotein dehydrogenase